MKQRNKALNFQKMETLLTIIPIIVSCLANWMEYKEKRFTTLLLCISVRVLVIFLATEQSWPLETELSQLSPLSGVTHLQLYRPVRLERLDPVPGFQPMWSANSTERT
jgi:hypothetical protein